MSNLKNCFPGNNNTICCQHDNGSWICFPTKTIKEKVPEKKSETISRNTQRK